jgi:hypothetical protein
MVSPASPEKASRLFRFSVRVLSSDDLRIVAPRMAALEEARRTKSLPVMPRRTSLGRVLGWGGLGGVIDLHGCGGRRCVWRVKGRSLFALKVLWNSSGKQK